MKMENQDLLFLYQKNLDTLLKETKQKEFQEICLENT